MAAMECSRRIDGLCAASVGGGGWIEGGAVRFLAYPLSHPSLGLHSY